METIRKVNRTLLEMQIGMVLWGLVCQAVGAFFVHDQFYYAKSLWFGILFGMVSLVHMYRSLDRALDFEEKNASKMIMRAYLFRYVLIAVILCIIMVTEVMNPLIVFLAYMGIKVTALMRPITHKLCNKMFHETDPVPQPLSETDSENGETAEADELLSTGEIPDGEETLCEK